MHLFVQTPPMKSNTLSQLPEQDITIVMWKWNVIVKLIILLARHITLLLWAATWKSKMCHLLFIVSKVSREVSNIWLANLINLYFILLIIIMAQCHQTYLEWDLSWRLHIKIHLKNDHKWVLLPREERYTNYTRLHIPGFLMNAFNHQWNDKTADEIWYMQIPEGLSSKSVHHTSATLMYKLNDPTTYYDIKEYIGTVYEQGLLGGKREIRHEFSENSW